MPSGSSSIGTRERDDLGRVRGRDPLPHEGRDCVEEERRAGSRPCDSWCSWLDKRAIGMDGQTHHAGLQLLLPVTRLGCRVRVPGSGGPHATSSRGTDLRYGCRSVWGSAPQVGALPAPAPPATATPCPKETPPTPERLRFRVSLAEGTAQPVVSGRLIVAMTQAKEIDDPSGHNANNPDFGHEFDHPGGIWFAAIDVNRFGANGAVELDPDVLASPRPFSLAPSGSWRISARLLRDGVQVLQGPVVERTVDPAHAGIVDLRLDAAVPPRPAPTETDSMKLVRVESKRLSAFYGRPIAMEAIVQVPTSYSADRTRHYATAYTILGWGTSLAGAWPWQAKLGKARAEQRYPEMVQVVLPVMLPEHSGHHGFADSVIAAPGAPHWSKS